MWKAEETTLIDPVKMHNKVFNLGFQPIGNCFCDESCGSVVRYNMSCLWRRGENANDDDGATCGRAQDVIPVEAASLSEAAAAPIDFGDDAALDETTLMLTMNH